MNQFYFKVSEDKTINKVLILCMAELRRYGFKADTYEAGKVSPAIAICFGENPGIVVTPAFKEFFELFNKLIAGHFYWEPAIDTIKRRDRIYAKITLPKYFQSLFMTERGRISFAVFFVSVVRKYYENCN